MGNTVLDSTRPDSKTNTVLVICCHTIGYSIHKFYILFHPSSTEVYGKFNNKDILEVCK